MATITLRLFASARESAGTGSVEVQAATVGEALGVARARFGADFASVLDASRVWLDGDEPVRGDATPLVDGAELAVLPPVSGGAGGG
jgi:molybdopterin converting factor small subunit